MGSSINDKLKYSFVIPARNAASSISKTLSSIKNLNFTSPYEVIVVDNMSTDETSQVASLFSGVQIVECGKIGRSAARNFGASHCQAEYIVFLDADVEIETDWLSQVDDYLSNTAVDFLGTSVVPSGIRDNYLDRYRFLFSQTKSLGTGLSLVKGKKVVPLINTASCVVRRETFKKLKGFNEDFVRNEDFELSFRAFSEGYILGGLSKAKGKVFFEPHYRGSEFFRILKYFNRYFYVGFFNPFPQAKQFLNILFPFQTQERWNEKVLYSLIAMGVYLSFMCGNFINRLIRPSYVLPSHREGKKTFFFSFMSPADKALWVLRKNCNVVLIDESVYLFNGFFEARLIPEKLGCYFRRSFKESKISDVMEDLLELDAFRKLH